MEEGYNPCPHCAEPIRKGAKICRYCNRPVGVMSPSEAPVTKAAASKPASVNKALWAAAVFAVLLAIAIYVMQNLRMAGARMDQAKQDFKINANQPESAPLARQWRYTGRGTLVNQTLDVQKIQGWTAKPLETLPGPTQRLTLHGSWASSEPVMFVVIDQDNWARMQQGYPPLVRYAVSEQPISTDWPQGGDFYGFVRVSQNQPLHLTGSLSGLALQMLLRAAEQSTPARVTVELWAEGSCFCTESEAQALLAKHPN